MLGIHRLQDAYFKRDPDYSRGITVPAMVDVPTGQVVTNDFPWITHDLFFEWRDYHRPDAPDLWPDDVREEMEEVMERVFTEVNNGVYRCGFAGSQEAYDEAYDRLWSTMDWLEERLGDRRYLMGDRDHRGRRTPVHDAGALRRGLPRPLQVQPQQARPRCRTCGATRATCSRRRGFGETIDFEQIKKHYYVVQSDVNPSGIVPKGPDTGGVADPARARVAGLTRTGAPAQSGGSAGRHPRGVCAPPWHRRAAPRSGSSASARRGRRRTTADDEVLLPDQHQAEHRGRERDHRRDQGDVVERVDDRGRAGVVDQVEGLLARALTPGRGGCLLGALRGGVHLAPGQGAGERLERGRGAPCRPGRGVRRRPPGG